MLGSNKKVADKAVASQKYNFTPEEIDLLSECIMRTENYYKGMLLLKQDWNSEKNEDSIALIKARLRMLADLQERTTYIGQSDLYSK